PSSKNGRLGWQIVARRERACSTSQDLTYHSPQVDPVATQARQPMTPRRQAAGALLVGGGIAFLCGVLFLWLARAVWVGEVDRLDGRILIWLQDHRTPALNNFFIGVTQLGAAITLTLMALGIAGAMLLGGWRSMAATFVGAMVGGMALSSLLKVVVG